MSTIASPRLSSSVQSPPSSSRSSISVDRQSVQSTAQRRNRLALRDYYGLKAEAPTDSSASLPNEDAPPPSELDKPDFDPQAYVADVLAKEGLEGVLRVEAGLVSEVRGFDGERKALVYDNYSKLIAATDTIRSMRTNMDPLTPMTTMLEPAVAHIAQTASDLGKNLRLKGVAGEAPARIEKVNDPKKDTVRWVLATPQRLRDSVQDGRREDAEADWTEIQTLLDRWEGVPGVHEIREESEAMLNG